MSRLLKWMGRGEKSSCPPPGSFGMPLVGEGVQFGKDPVAFGDVRRAKHGPVFKSRILNVNSVFAADHASVVEMLEHEHFSPSDSWLAVMGELYTRDALPLLPPGPEHARSRYIWERVMDDAMLEALYDALHALVRRHVRRMVDAGTVALYEECKRMAQEAVMLSFLGYTPGLAYENFVTLATQQFRGAVAIPLKLPGLSYASGVKARDALLAVLQLEIDKHRGEGADAACTCVLHKLVFAEDADGRTLTDAQICSNLMWFTAALIPKVFASCMTMFAVSMANEPAEMARVRDEQCNVLGLGPEHAHFEHGDALDVDVTFAQLRAMPVLESVLHESFRLHPPLVVGMRGLDERAFLAGYDIPADWKGWMLYVAANRDATVYPQPLRFSSARWRPTDNARDHTTSACPFHLSFGGEQRRCVGMGLTYLVTKLFASCMARVRWHVEPGQDMTLKLIPTTRPKDGARTTLQRLSIKHLHERFHLTN